MSQYAVGASFMARDYERWSLATQNTPLHAVPWVEFLALVRRVEKLERGGVVKEEDCEFVRNLICVS